MQDQILDYSIRQRCHECWYAKGHDWKFMLFFITSRPKNQASSTEVSTTYFPSMLD